MKLSPGKLVLLSSIIALALLSFYSVQEANQDISDKQPIPLEGILPESTLLEYALQVAKLQGMVENLSAKDIDASQAIYTTYREWSAFMGGDGGDPDPEPGLLGVENAGRPVFIIPIYGSGFFPLGPEGTDIPGVEVQPTPLPTYAMLIILFADTGATAGYGVAQIDTPLPDLSVLRASSSIQPRESTAPADTIPLP